MANHYHDCVKPNVFDKNGYFLHQTNQRKRSFSQTATSQTSHSPNAKKQKLNEDDEEYVDLSYSNITPNQYKKYEQLLLTDMNTYKYSNQQQQLFEKLVGLWVIQGKGLDHSVFDNSFAKLALKVVNPLAKWPSRAALTDRIIPQIKKDIKQIVDDDIKKAGTAQISMDGSNDSHEPITHILALTPKPRLILQKRCKYSKENADKLLKYFDEGEKYCKEIACDTSSNIGDNCRTNKALNKRIKKSKPKVATPGCGSHVWQLVNKDNMKRKKHKSTLKKAKAVQSRCIKSKFGGFVKENKVEHDIIQKIEIIHNITDRSDPKFNELYKIYYDVYNKRNGFTKTPQTREWGSTFKLYENQIKYKKHIKRTLDSDQIEKTKQYLKPTLKNKTNIKKIIEDEQHWNDMQEYLDKYELIRERLIKSQGDVNVSDIEYHFHRVQAKYEDEEYKYYDARTAESVKKRFELIEDDIHFAGKITDPRRVGEAIDIDDYEKGIRYLKLHFGEEEWENKWQDIFVLFEDHDGIFAKRQLLNMNDHNMFDAINWWSYFQRFKIKSNGNTLELKPFCKVMIKIAKVLGTNAKMEST
eukprot:136762_1